MDMSQIKKLVPEMYEEIYTKAVQLAEEEVGNTPKELSLKDTEGTRRRRIDFHISNMVSLAHSK